MTRWQWGILSGSALMASIWANGMGTLVGMLLAAALGLIAGLIMGEKVIP